MSLFLMPHALPQRDLLGSSHVPGIKPLRCISFYPSEEPAAWTLYLHFTGGETEVPRASLGLCRKSQHGSSGGQRSDVAVRVWALEADSLGLDNGPPSPPPPRQLCESGP